MNNLPATDCECDERLVKVLAVYIAEKAMPLKVAADILLNELRDKSTYIKRLNELIQCTRATSAH
jgi:hypothetical protein